MTDPNPTDDEALLDRFRDWLRDARAEADGLDGDRVAPPNGPEVGLYRLAEEFTALRHEVKLETKGSRGLQEQIDALLPTLRQAIDQFRSVAPKEEQAASAVGKPMAEAMADLDEALARGRLEIEKARDRLIAEAAASAASIESDLDELYRGQSWFRRRGLRSYHEQVRGLLARRPGGSRSGPFDALLEGYGLIQDRLKRSMDAGQVRRIDCVGRAVDPALMTVLEVVDSTDELPGHVVDEVRRGYTWRGRVLRYAEVRAARERAVEEIEEEGEVEAEDEFEDAEEPELGAD
jgi:molecular chaperone GrpE